MVLAVDKNVPIPASRKVYPYNTMDIGDSFFVANGNIQLVCNANFRASKRLCRKFSARKENGGIRVWRIS